VISLVTNFILGWGGLGVLIGIGAVVWASFMPIFKREALMVAAVAFAATFIYGKGYNDGAAVVQSRWDAAVKATDITIDDAIRGADGDVAGGVRDPNDRDDH
jgi:hypothetical protein